MATKIYRSPQMEQDLWINLPVKDLARSVTFFTALGFAPNPGPGNSAQSASFTIGQKKIVLMLFVQDLFTSFTSSPLSDTSRGSEVLFSLGADSRDEVDDIANRARAAGGTVFSQPHESQGFMYGCGFSDADGHRWNVLFMDTTKIPRPITRKEAQS